MTVPPNLTANLAAVQRFWQGFNSHNLEVWDEICAPGFINHDPGLPTPDADLATIKETIARLWFGAFPDLHSVEQELLVDGEKVPSTRVQEGEEGRYVVCDPRGTAVLEVEVLPGTGIHWRRLSDGRGSIGLTMGDVDDALAAHLEVDPAETVLVTDVAPGGPAETAGIRRFDVVPLDRRVDLAPEHPMRVAPMHTVAELDEVGDTEPELLEKLAPQAYLRLLGSLQTAARQTPLADLVGAS